jgi:hypothetical protein
MQFVEGVNLVLQTWVKTAREASEFAREDGFELGSTQLLCAQFKGKTIVEHQWQERID